MSYDTLRVGFYWFLICMVLCFGTWVYRLSNFSKAQAQQELERDEARNARTAAIHAYNEHMRTWCLMSTEDHERLRDCANWAK